MSKNVTFEIVKIELLLSSPFNPRKRFDKKPIQELADSIREHGVIQPLVVRPSAEPGCYEVVAGERRLRAARRAGLAELPVTVKELSDQQVAELAVTENIQREDMTLMEEASGVRSLLAWFTPKELAAKLGKSQMWISRRKSLNDLPKEARKALDDGILPLDVANALLKVSPGDQLEALDRVLSPEHHAGALSRDVALRVLRAEFIEPYEMRQEYRRRNQRWMCGDNGEAGGLEAEEYFAEDFARRFVLADERPRKDQLASYLRVEGAEVPTWGELAAKYDVPLRRAEIPIGQGPDGWQWELHSFVEWEPLRDLALARADEEKRMARRAAEFQEAEELQVDSDVPEPELCPFASTGEAHESALEREKMEREARARAADEKDGLLKKLLDLYYFEAINPDYADEIRARLMNRVVEMLAPEIIEISAAMPGDADLVAPGDQREFIAGCLEVPERVAVLLLWRELASRSGLDALDEDDRELLLV